ncbi:unnamed protein product [Calypogeia fissa]
MSSTYWLKAFLLLTMVRMATQDTHFEFPEYSLTCLTDDHWVSFPKTDFVKGVLNLFLKADDPHSPPFEQFTMLPPEIYLPVFPGGDANKQWVTLTVSGTTAFGVLDHRVVNEKAMQAIARRELYDAFDFLFKECCKDGMTCRGGLSLYKRLPGFQISIQVPTVHAAMTPLSGGGTVPGHDQIPVDYVYAGYTELFCKVRDFNPNTYNDFHHRLGPDGAIEVPPNQVLVLYRHQSHSREPMQFSISADNHQQPIRVKFQLISTILAEAIAHSCSIYTRIPSLCPGAMASVHLGNSQIYVSYSLGPQDLMHNMGMPQQNPAKKTLPGNPGDDYHQETPDYTFTCYRKDKWPLFHKKDYDDGLATMFETGASRQVTLLPEELSLPLFPLLASPESPIKQRTTFTTRGNLRFSAADTRDVPQYQWRPRSRKHIESAFRFVQTTCCIGSEPCRGGSASSRKSPGLQVFLDGGLSQPSQAFNKPGQILAKHVYDGYVESFCQHKNPPPDFHNELSNDGKFRVPPNHAVKVLHTYRPPTGNSVLFTIYNQNPTQTALSVPFDIISSMMSRGVAQCIVIGPRTQCEGKEVAFNFGGSTIRVGYARGPAGGGQEGPSTPQTGGSAKKGKRSGDQSSPDQPTTKKGKQTAAAKQTAAKAN